MKTLIESQYLLDSIQKITEMQNENKPCSWLLQNIKRQLVTFANCIEDTDDHSWKNRQRAIDAVCLVQAMLTKHECNIRIDENDFKQVIIAISTIHGIHFVEDQLTQKEKLMLLATCDGMDDHGQGWLHEMTPFENEHVAAGVIGQLEKKGLIRCDLVKEKGLPDVYYVTITSEGVSVASKIFGELWAELLQEFVGP